MDVETINKLSIIAPPLYLRDDSNNSSNNNISINKELKETTAAPPNSIAVSSFGDVVLISDGGRIVFVPIRPATSSSSSVANANSGYQELPFESEGDKDAISSCEFTNIAFNEDSSALILWSSNSIGVVEIPRSLTLNGSIDPSNKRGKRCCSFYNLSKLLNLGGSSQQMPFPNSMRLIKVLWHRLSSHHVVTLQENGPLTVIDIVSQTAQAIPLNSRYNFTSFCFGPEVDWMAVSVLLVTDTADIFAVCPVLPRGCPIAAKTVSGMKEWLDEQERCVLELAQKSRRRSGYFENAWKYCKEAFGSSAAADSDMNKNHVAANNNNSPFDDRRRLKDDSAGRPIIAGSVDVTAASKANGVSADISNTSPMFATTPKLQGPFMVSCMPAASRREAKERKGIVVTDMCTPRGGSRRGVPIICVSYSDGLVEIYIFKSDGTESFYVGPSWLHSTNSALRSAELLFVEAVGGSDGSSRSREKWTIEADPIFGHIFHLTNRSSCSSYLLSSPWLSKAIDDDNSTAANRKSSDAAASSAEDDKNSPSSVGHGSSSSSLQPSLLTPVFTPSTACPLIGSAIIYDPMIGHVTMFRKGDGKTAVVNLTVHVRLCELQKALRRCEGGSASFANDLDALIGRQDMAREREVSQLCSICDGLYSIPTYSSDAGTPEGSKELACVVEHLERCVLLPLEELHMRMQMRLESLQEAWAIQHDLVMGGARGGGLIAELEGLQEGSTQLRLRIATLNRRFEEQKGDIENSASLVYLTKSKVSRAERDYYRQLKEWEGQIERMNGALEPLQTLAKSTLSASRQQQNNFKGHVPISSGSPAAFMRQRLNSNVLASPARGSTPLSAHPGSAVYTPSKVLKSAALTPGSKSIHSNPASAAAAATTNAASSTAASALPRHNISKESIEKCSKMLEAQERCILELAGELSALELCALRR